MIDLAANSCRWLYIDCFPWMKGCFQKNHAPQVIEGSFMNLGTVHPNMAKDTIDYWAALCDGERVYQISIGMLNYSVQEIVEFSRSISRERPGIFVITSSEKGLAIAEAGDVSFSQSSSISNEHFVDSAGAGAAVSAKYLDHILRGERLERGALAAKLTEHGTAQCRVTGALPASEYIEWVTELDRNLPNA
ncbi:hypothetical protein [Novosphingobium sp. B 225]|uniref:hypothetical protein n=1 Tax=Novosphingobium sp. B 225 TaxID=1961849 RepID=UPI0011250AE3|nr:hypothetical protein [Novosphingobium sp. B 225]